jgi:Adenylate and Guanylate cyclase catalytic domain/zinc-ribbon domain
MTVCSKCGQENPEGARFCNACAAQLEVAPTAREQRKTVTVLFCDVTGSTSLGESTDPEAIRALLARYFERMKAIVESHGGTVEKFIGDAVMAVFGVPQVHEDDALRACRAAVEMREALPELGVQARIGVNTGEVVTGTEERLATGDAVNVAARGPRSNQRWRKRTSRAFQARELSVPGARSAAALVHSRPGHGQRRGHSPALVAGYGCPV